MNTQAMAIMVVSFDKYHDIWDVFAQCLNRFWADRTYATYLVANEAEINYEGIIGVNTGPEISWSHRVRQALETIREEYILLLLEDYLICKEVDNKALFRALEYMKDNNLDYLRIAPIPVLKTKKEDGFAAEITPEMIYGVNLQAAIWKRSYLLETLGNSDFSAWEFEARQKFDASTRVNGRCRATKEFVLPYLNGIIQGKWYLKTVQTLEELGISVPLGLRAVMTDKDMRRENFRNYLLHHIPVGLIRGLKPIAKKLGFKFVT